VFQTPVRLTAMTSCQSWSLEFGPPTPMPALASTIVGTPSSAIPSARALRRPSTSRTSAWRATIRRPVASTSFTVCARSSGVDIAYDTEEICAQMSTAMMSAPSWASRTA
jgi:hypothetical protein